MGIDEREVHHFSVSYLPFNTWIYLFSLPEISPYFPFLRTVWPGELPAGYVATEEMPGLLFALPVHLLGAIAVFHAWRQRHETGGEAFRLTLSAGAGASLLAAGLLFCFAGACSRYIAELVAGWSLVTGVGFLVVLSSGTGLRLPGWFRPLAVVAAAWSVLCVWLASLEFRNFARNTQPVFYGAVAETLNYPSYWAAQKSGQVYGPVSLDLRLADAPSTGAAMLMASGREGMLNQLLIERTGTDGVRLKLVENDLTMVETPGAADQRNSPSCRLPCALAVSARRASLLADLRRRR